MMPWESIDFSLCVVLSMNMATPLPKNQIDGDDDGDDDEDDDDNYDDDDSLDKYF